MNNPPKTIFDFFTLVETERLNRIEAKINQLLKGQQMAQGDLDAITAQVAQTNTVEDSAIVLINGLAAQIVQLQNDPVALQALADSLNAKSTELAGAIAAVPPPGKPGG
jgi:peptidoglycan hydrolase CwlO-like protein